VGKDEGAKGQNRRYPDTDVNTVESAFDVVTGLEVDRHAEEKTCEGRNEERAFQNSFWVHVITLAESRARHLIVGCGWRYAEVASESCAG
jgi:hypothetical protein